jgi:thiamine biosynthesis lipoprotein
MTLAATRRRFLCIVAGASAASLAAFAAGRGADAGRPVVWRGRALGAEAELRVVADDEALASGAIAGAVAEAARLEAVFSLYRADSELSRLNRDGHIEPASIDLRRVIAASQRWSLLTDGGFDVTVQPLWDLYARHFTAQDADPEGPAAEAIAATSALVDHRGIVVDGDSIALQRPGMAVTLNGIAQGYITDRVAAVLAGAGFPHSLVNMGEIAAPAAPPGETGWRVGIADPRAPGRIIDRITLGPGQALATSSGLGTRFGSSGRHHHIFDPATGQSSQAVLAVTVLARHATTADALSTALAVRGIAGAQRLLRAGGAEAALVLGHDGRLRRIQA